MHVCTKCTYGHIFKCTFSNLNMPLWKHFFVDASDYSTLALVLVYKVESLTQNIINF